MSSVFFVLIDSIILNFQNLRLYIRHPSSIVFIVIDSIVSNLQNLRLYNRHMSCFFLVIQDSVIPNLYLFLLNCIFLLFSGYLMRFILAANLLGLPAISVPVSVAYLFLRILSDVFNGLCISGTQLSSLVNTK